MYSDIFMHSYYCTDHEIKSCSPEFVKALRPPEGTGKITSPSTENISTLRNVTFCVNNQIKDNMNSWVMMIN